MPYKGTKKSLSQIARELNVDALVEGTVLRSGDRARVTACLVHAATGRQLWAATYESELRDISSSQGQVAQAIAHAIGLRHTNQQQAQLRTSRPTTPEAYEAFLKGRHYWDIQMPEGQLKCIEYYKRAIQADGKYALAYAQMAHCYDTLSFWEFPPAREYRQKALDAARKALDLDGSVAEAHLILADQKLYVDWNWSGAEAEFRRAMEMDPSSVDAVCHYGYCLEVLGRFDEAIRVMEAAHRLDPLSHLVNVQLGRAFYDAHQDQRAVEQFQEMIRFEPNDAAAYDSLGSVYESLSRYEEAEKTYLKGAGLAGVNVGRTRDLQQAYSSGGIRGYWKAVLDYEHSMARREHAAPLKLASIYAHLGEKDQAIACLERAYQQHAVALIWLKADRSWDLLRSDARYQNLLRRMNFPP
jgi:tetratricopeptide (TPR) repeat protein